MEVFVHTDVLEFQELCRRMYRAFIIHCVAYLCAVWPVYEVKCGLKLHSLSKCLVWVRKCCHHWLDQNFGPSLLTSKFWLVFMGIKQKKKIFEKKNQNGRLKIANSQYFFVKISWIGSWISRIDWSKGHWFGSTHMVLRLSDISSKAVKKCIFGVF